MNALDWLHGNAEQKAPAGERGAPRSSGPIQTFLSELAGQPVQLAMAPPELDEAQPTGFIQFDGVTPQQQVQQFRDSIQIYARPRPKFTGEALQCPCAVIYGRCYYGHA